MGKKSSLYQLYQDRKNTMLPSVSKGMRHLSEITMPTVIKHWYDMVLDLVGVNKSVGELVT